MIHKNNPRDKKINVFLVKKEKISNINKMEQFDWMIRNSLSVCLKRRKIKSSEKV